MSRCFFIMSKSNQSHSRTQNGNPQPKRPWYGQDNLKLRTGHFSTLIKWLDVDHLYHPVKDYAQALKEVLWQMHPEHGERQAQLYAKVKKLCEDLMILDSEIDKLMKEGGPQCR